MNNIEVKLFPFKLFEINNEKYLFTSKKNRILKITEEIYNTLSNTTNEYTINLQKNSPLMKILEENSIVEEEETLIGDALELQSIILMVIQDCNLKCKYCYGDGGEFQEKGIMNVQTAKNAIDFLINNCGNRKSVNVVFFGGEPLLNFNVIKETINYIEEIESKTKIKINKSITTNATLLTENIKTYLLDKRVSIKISIDGSREINDNMRVFADGKGTFDAIMRNTESLRNSGKVVARATITSAFLDTKTIEDFLYQQGFSNVGMAYAAESLTEEDYEKIYKIESSYFGEIKKLIKVKKYDEIRNRYTKIMAYLTHIHSSVIGNYPCGAGRTMFAVDKNGNLFPCQRFVGVDKYSLGNINNGHGDNEKFLERVNISSHIKCQKCWCKNLCIGKCPYDNYAKTGKVEEPYDVACRLTQKLYEKAITFYVSLTESERKQLFL